MRNPTVEDILLEASIQGLDLSGPDSITIPVGEKTAYSLTYAPTKIGYQHARLVTVYKYCVIIVACDIGAGSSVVKCHL